jgi:CheY-like chemotaxis protein
MEGTMKIVRLIHWKPEEAAKEIQYLENAGYEVISAILSGPSFLKNLEADNPDVLLIDLSRVPSQGRDLAVAVRMRKGTRHIPIVFAAGKAEKVEAIQALLPDAVYTDWHNVPIAIDEAIQRGVEDPIVPDSAFAAYAGKPLAEKLGIKPGFTVSLVNAPTDFGAVLGKLPGNTSLMDGVDPGSDLVVWFVRSEDDLQGDMESIVRASQQAPVWIAWPKRGGAMESGLTQQMVRQQAMAQGMVDYKICSIDQDWSALLFKWRGGDVEPTRGS